MSLTCPVAQGRDCDEGFREAGLSSICRLIAPGRRTEDVLNEDLCHQTLMDEKEVDD